MKKIIFILVISTLLSSCIKREINSKQINYRNGIAYAVNEEKPFNGIINTYSKKGYLYSSQKTKNGLGEIHTTFYPNGQVKSIYNAKENSQTWYDKNGEITKEKPPIDDLIDIDLDI